MNAVVSDENPALSRMMQRGYFDKAVRIDNFWQA